MKNYYSLNGNLYEGSNNRITGMYGIPTGKTGLQYNVTTPTVAYQGYDWSCVEAEPIATVPVRRTATTQKKPRGFFKTLFGLR